MRYLGIDFGSKRVGVAVSDESNSFAFPLVVLPNSPNLIDEIKKIFIDYNIGEIVIGDSKDFAQIENEIMKEIRPFVVLLKKELNVTISLHPEFLSSLEAKQLQGKNTMLDASAAAIILKSFLDTKNNKK